MQQGPISTFSIAVGVVSAIMAMSSVVCLIFHNTTSIALLFLRGRRWLYCWRPRFIQGIMIYRLQYQLATPGLDHRLGAVNSICVATKIIDGLAEAGFPYSSSVCWIRRMAFQQRLILYIECISAQVAEAVDRIVQSHRVFSELQLDNCLAQAEAVLGETICLDKARFYQTMAELLRKKPVPLPSDPEAIVDPELAEPFRYDWVCSRHDLRAFRLQMIYLRLVKPDLTDRLVLPIIRMAVNDRLDRLAWSFGAGYDYDSVIDHGDDDLALHYRYLVKRQVGRRYFQYQLRQILDQLVMNGQDCDCFQKSIQVGLHYLSPLDLYSGSGVLAGTDDLIKAISVDNMNRTLRKLKLQSVDYLEVAEADYA